MAEIINFPNKNPQLTAASKQVGIEFHFNNAGTKIVNIADYQRNKAIGISEKPNVEASTYSVNLVDMKKAELNEFKTELTKLDNSTLRSMYNAGDSVYENEASKIYFSLGDQEYLVANEVNPDNIYQLNEIINEILQERV